MNYWHGLPSTWKMLKMFKPAFVSHALLLYAAFAFSRCLAIENFLHLFSFAIAAILVLFPPREGSEQIFQVVWLPFWQKEVWEEKRVNSIFQVVWLPLWRREEQEENEAKQTSNFLLEKAFSHWSLSFPDDSSHSTSTPSLSSSTQMMNLDFLSLLGHNAGKSITITSS